MKEMGVIGRWALILLLLGNVYGGFAQDANTARAQHIYELFVAGQGDSIHAALNRELQEKLAPALFNDSFRQAEKMFGKSIPLLLVLLSLHFRISNCTYDIKDIHPTDKIGL